MLGFGAFKFRQDLKDYCGIGEPGLIDLNARFAGASIVVTVPIIRELLFLMGVRDANRTTLELLNAGHTIAVIQPGGIWEMVMTDSSQVRARAHTHTTLTHHLSLSHTTLSLTHTTLSSLSQEALYFQRSLGFVRLAMEMGRPLLATVWREPAIPSRGAATAYAYGSRGSCAPACHSSTAMGPALMLTRRYRQTSPLSSDGTCRPARANPNPTDAEVEAVFKRYIDEVCRLFVANAGTNTGGGRRESLEDLQGRSWVYKAREAAEWEWRAIVDVNGVSSDRLTQEPPPPSCEQRRGTSARYRKPRLQQTMNPATRQQAAMARSPVRHAMMMTGRTSSM